ncbi:MAG: YjbH domain-containing protein [Hahellaceae bacterium]|nr:YjbH domain-containing protein [Hahellaceae bacterium]
MTKNKKQTFGRVFGWAATGAVGMVVASQAAAGNALSFNGFSGVLNTPDAWVVEHGYGVVQYSDQVFTHNRYRHNDNVNATFGIFPHLEVGGRISWDSTHNNCFTEGCGVRDLSANLKLNVPYIPDDWFTLAVGVQDFGGEVNYFDAYYAVASRQFGPVAMSVGYGQADIVDRYLDGPFANMVYRPTEWVGLLAEYDAQDVNAGLELSTPEALLPWGMKLRAKSQFYSSSATAEDKQFFAVSVDFPLGEKTRTPVKREASLAILPIPKPVVSADVSVGGGTKTSSATPPKSSPAGLSRHWRESSEADLSPIAPTRENADSNEAIESNKASLIDTAVLRQLGETLVDEGYESVQVGVSQGQVFVAYENNTYNRNELTAVDHVGEIVAHALSGKAETATLIMKNQQIAVLHQVIRWGEGEQVGQIVAQKTVLADSRALNQVQWRFEGSNGVHWKPRFTFSPSLSSGVATEYGVWDYSLALDNNVALNLWTGALASLTYVVPVDESDDFKAGGYFYNARQREGVSEVEIQQTLKLLPGLYTSFKAGKYSYDYTGVMNQTLLILPGRTDAVGFYAGKFTHKDNEYFDRVQRLAYYRHYFTDYDVALNFYAGQFWEEDTGFRIDTRFWFGDKAVDLFYKNTDNEYVGIRWMIPLTPQKDYNGRYATIRGKEDWNYGVQTRINDDLNFLGFGNAAIMGGTHYLERTYFNGFRLDP